MRAPTYVVEWPDIGETPETGWVPWAASGTAALDHQIYDVRSLLGAAKCGYIGRADLKALMDRAYALQAERAKFAV